MCGRYQLAQTDPTAIGLRFGFDERGIDADALGRLNVSPTEKVLAVTGEGPRLMRWGLVPPWSKGLRDGPHPINGRAESCFDKAPFARLAGQGQSRCLVVADGWYEWLRPETPRGERVPFLYRVDGGELFAFAGVWDTCRLDGESVVSAAVLTTAANAVCAPVHDRMPCVLADREAELAWLSAEVDRSAAAELLAPLDPARVSVVPADRSVFRRDTGALTLF